MAWWWKQNDKCSKNKENASRKNVHDGVKIHDLNAYTRNSYIKIMAEAYATMTRVRPPSRCTATRFLKKHWSLCAICLRLEPSLKTRCIGEKFLRTCYPSQCLLGHVARERALCFAVHGREPSTGKTAEGTASQFCCCGCLSGAWCRTAIVLQRETQLRNDPEGSCNLAPRFGHDSERRATPGTCAEHSRFFSCACWRLHPI